MAITINGTTGLAGVDGSAGTPSYQGGDSNTGIFFPAADTIAFAEGGAEVARFDSSGNLGIGISSPGGRLDVRGPAGYIGYFRDSGTGAYASVKTDASGPIIEYGNGSAGLRFGDGSTERARITSSGYSKFSNDGTYIGASSSYHEFRNTANASTLILSATSASLADDLFAIYASRNTTNNTFYAINYYNSGAGAYRFRVADSGNVTNTNNSYGAISDAKLKENVTDATPKLEKLTQVRVVNYNLIGETQKQIGVIAQELEPIFPGMVEETPDRDEEGNDLGTTTKSVKYSVFVPMLIKAIQEQQALINDLTARIAALEAA